MYHEKLHNTKKLAKHKYIMFWNFKSSNRNLRSQKLKFYIEFTNQFEYVHTKIGSS